MRGAPACKGRRGDRRRPALAVHTLAAMLRFRMQAIACGYEDADDCDSLRTDPMFKLGVRQAEFRCAGLILSRNWELGTPFVR